MYEWDLTISLEHQIREGEQFLSILKSTNYQDALIIANLFRQTSLNFLGRTNDRFSLNDSSFDISEVLKQIMERKYLTGAGLYHLLKLQISFMYDDCQRGSTHLKECGKFVKTFVVSPYYGVIYCFYSFLTLAVLLPEMSFREKKQAWRRLKEKYRRMKRWTDHYPANFLHFFLLMQAEQARLTKKFKAAAKLYDQAIAETQSQGYLRYIALANELAAKFYLSQEDQARATPYIKEAHYWYRRWGATVKVTLLEEHYPQFFIQQRESSANPQNLRQKQESPLSSGEGSRSFGDPPLSFPDLVGGGSGLSPIPVDLKAITEASQALSKEVVLEKLLRKLMEIVCQDAGAEKALLLLGNSPEHLLIQAQSMEGQEISVMQAQSVAENQHLSLSIVQYVARSRETVLLGDAAHEGSFSQDSYIQQQQPKSLLCLPLIHQSKGIGMLYLENNKARDAFTANHLEILGILASQAAISIENAQLYQESLWSKQELINAKQTKIDNLQEVNKLKDEFLAKTSHELRTPLHGIIGITQSLMTKLAGQIPQETLKDLSLVVDNSKRLSHVVNDLLDFSTLRHSTLRLHIQPLNLKSMADGVLRLCEPLVQHKAIQLINRIDPGCPIVDGDQERMEQIFYNLIGNAIKFTSAGQVEITAQARDASVEIQVKDSGVGIAEEELEHIFEAFEQVSGADQTGGTGLGLSITKQLVEFHGGHLTVQSVLGKGSCFSFTLSRSIDQPRIITPVSQEDTSEGSVPCSVSLEPPQQVSEKIRFSHEKLFHERPAYGFQILAVDDDPTNLHLLNRYLEQSPYQVAYAPTGLDALKWIEDHGKPDLVLLDVMMPKLDGFEVCRKIRQQYPLYEVPVIFLTARNEMKDLVEGFDVGGNDYLCKPFEQSELLARVRSQLLLTLAKNRLTLLQEFSRQLGRFEDTQQIFEAAFELLCDEKHITHVALFQKDSLIQSKPSSVTILERGYQPWKQNQLAQTWHKACLMFLPLNGSREYTIGLQSCSPLTDMDFEYIQHVFNQVQINRKFLNGISLNPRQFSDLHTIASQLDKIVFIQAQNQYCLVYEDKQQSPIALRLPLKYIKQYLSDDVLLQVHRSYLIHPNKVSRLNKIAHKRFELLIRSHRIPVGLQYLPKVWKMYHSAE